MRPITHVVRKLTIAASFLLLATPAARSVEKDRPYLKDSAGAPGLSMNSPSVVLPNAGHLELEGGLPAGAILKAWTNIKPDRGLSRDIHSTQIYRAASPAVVLIVTDESLGSGSLISADGLILTNLHVVAGQTKVAVVFKPKQEGAKLKAEDAVPAEVIRRNASKDLALLKVAYVPPQIAPIKLGKMDEIMIGADVHAIGHPTGESWTYTKGVISQIRRDFAWMSEDKTKHQATVIQTQTPISPGNSGGPLLSDDGTLAGVNSFKSTEGENLNFAVSVAEVQSFLEQKGDVAAVSAPTNSTAKAASCKEPQIIFQGSNKEGSADLVLFDTKCSGVANGELISPHDKNEPLIMALFVGDYSKRTVMYFDPKRTGDWEYSFWRDKPTDSWQLYCTHEKGNIKPSKCEKYETYLAKN